MSSMALYREFRPRRARVTDRSKSTPACGRQGILGRIFAAIARLHVRQAEQEAGRFIAKHGARLTDDIERQLTEHLNGRGFPPYAAPRGVLRFPYGS